MGKFYITTPIYYVNATPHIGHAYTTIVADTIKRFRRMQGDEAILTTGTDEHGQKVERSAEAAGWTPQEFTDRVSNAFRAEWDELGLEYDYFQRTTAPNHAKAVQWLFSKCKENGFIEKSTYTGKYDVTNEAFVTDEEAEQIDGPVEVVTEENYFFKLSAFQDKLIELYESQPKFIQPESRRNEVMAFVKGGLKDLSISRSTLKWGIPLPDDPEHVFYVWFDALTTYMSALGFSGDDPSTWEKLWPADVHLVGKEIVRFHAVYWPAFLMAAGLPLPKQIYAHGWLIFQGGKMSKSKGNIVRANPIHKAMGIEALRYFLLREIVFGADGNFSFEALIGRYNSDLANGIGNLSSRTLTMVHRNSGGQFVKPANGGDPAIAKQAAETIATASAHFENFAFSKGLEAVWALLGTIDKHIVERKPWILAKKDDDESQQLLAETLYNAGETLRIAAALVYPVLPEAAGKIWYQLGLGGLQDYKLADLAWGGIPDGHKVNESEQVFPRLDVAATVKKLEALEEEALAAQAEIMGKKPVKTELDPPLAPQIEIDDFAKVDLRVGEIQFAEKHPKADKLLHLKVDIGEPEPRTILAGIAKAYDPEKLVGRRVVIVANLKPRKMRGIESQGMIVAAEGSDGTPVLVGFHEDVQIGSRLR